MPVDILRKQLELVEKHYPETLSNSREEETNSMLLAIVEELAEISGCYKAFRWKKEHTDVKTLLEEVTDVLHFVLEIYLIWGVRDWSEVEKMYLAKLEKNLNERGRVHEVPSHIH